MIDVYLRMLIVQGYSLLYKCSAILIHFNKLKFLITNIWDFFLTILRTIVTNTEDNTRFSSTQIIYKIMENELKLAQFSSIQLNLAHFFHFCSETLHSGKKRPRRPRRFQTLTAKMSVFWRSSSFILWNHLNFSFYANIFTAQSTNSEFCAFIGHSTHMVKLEGQEMIRINRTGM